MYSYLMLLVDYIVVDIYADVLYYSKATYTGFCRYIHVLDGIFKTIRVMTAVMKAYTAYILLDKRVQFTIYIGRRLCGLLLWLLTSAPAIGAAHFIIQLGTGMAWAILATKEIALPGMCSLALLGTIFKAISECTNPIRYCKT